MAEISGPKQQKAPDLREEVIPSTPRTIAVREEIHSKEDVPQAEEEEFYELIDSELLDKFPDKKLRVKDENNEKIDPKDIRLALRDIVLAGLSADGIFDPTKIDEYLQRGARVTHECLLDVKGELDGTDNLNPVTLDRGSHDNPLDSVRALFVVEDYIFGREDKCPPSD